MIKQNSDGFFTQFLPIIVAYIIKSSYRLLSHIWLSVKVCVKICKMCFEFRFRSGLVGNIDNKVGHLVFSAKTPILLHACSKQSHTDLKDRRLTAGLFGNLC